MTISSLSAIPGPPIASWWKGNFSQVFNRLSGWEFHRHLLETYGGVVRLKMLLGDEQLYVTDPLALHHIIIRDQYIYEETAMFLTSNMLYFGKSLLSTPGDQHKKQRKILNPIFSLKHMRGLLQIFYPIAHQLRDILINEIRDSKETIDVMKWMSRAALEYIGQGGLGYSFDAFDEKKGNNYSDAMKQLSPINARLFLPRQLLPHAVKVGTPAFRRKLLEWAPFDLVRTATKISDAVTKCASDILHDKLQGKEEEDVVVPQVGKGNDIMSVLLRANADTNEEDRMPESEILGHMGSFIFAGHDTTTIAICRILHQLALHPDMQDRLREEVSATRKERGDLEYDVLMSLPCLDAVCRETLRLFPPVPQLNRTTRKDVVLPLLWPIKSVDGKTEIKEIPLKKNTNVIISIVGANTNKRIWGEDAEEWKPDRWLKPLPESGTKVRLPGIYSSTMTFLGGGRACIGFKFAEMEIKTSLSILLETFIFEPGPDIFWAMNFLQSPVLNNSDDMVTQQLPLKVSLVERHTSARV
ncbi:cytochrome P450 [Fomitiporia mediterranea MF3/22]|uniref:cytochrome P450 n=1 Tax=Fomitiporia mediterranea (strain MF3/22) TaxID=694068 RepID=UPI0004408AD4|nr:cytochrome P450 [Fomitiporia mediterranea MF3/22]EJC98472.1 cytochrome P450 [Fomitiporia mediterranea MF3/22]